MAARTSANNSCPNPPGTAAIVAAAAVTGLITGATTSSSPEAATSDVSGRRKSIFAFALVVSTDPFPNEKS